MRSKLQLTLFGESASSIQPPPSFRFLSSTMVAIKKEDMPPTSSKKPSFIFRPSVQTAVIFPVLLAYMRAGSEVVAYIEWCPLLFLGFVRWDVFVFAAVFLYLPWLYAVLARKNWAWMLAVLLLILPRILPPAPFSIGPAPISTIAPRVRTASTDLTVKESIDLANIAWQYNHDWSHDSTAYALGSFYWGRKAHVERDARRRPELYSLQFGLEPTRFRRMKESRYLLRFPQVIAMVQTRLRDYLMPHLRRAYAKALGVPQESDIMFGEELLEGLGFPVVILQYPNIIWNWVAEPDKGGKWSMTSVRFYMRTYCHS